MEGSTQLLSVRYRTRLNAAVKAVDELGWGGRSKVARGIGVAPTIVSAVLNGRMVNVEYLGRIEDYISKETGE